MAVKSLFCQIWQILKKYEECFFRHKQVNSLLTMLIKEQRIVSANFALASLAQQQNNIRTCVSADAGELWNYQLK